MQIYIVRHGIAIDREDPKCPPDPERYLTEEGVEKTKQVAKGVAALGITGDLFLTSPYVRAAQTAEVFANALDYAKQKIRRTDLLLPGAEPTQLFRELARDKQVSTVFLFGHAPQLDDIIATALGSKKHVTEKGGCGFRRTEASFSADWPARVAGDSQDAAASGEVG